jgi:hypothetical protein
MPPSTCGGGTIAYVNGFNEEVSEATNDKLAAVLAPTLLHASLLICSCM